MKISQMGIGTTRLQSIDEQFPAQDILVQSGQLLQFGAGIYAYNNIPLMLKQKIESIVREELEKIGGVEISLPTLQQVSLWKESGRLERYVSDGTMMIVNEGEYCLAPTAEEAVVAFARNKINSYRDLPIILYQIGEKYRNELRTRGYLLRGKTFPMMDAYSFATDEKDLIIQYDLMKQAYMSIFKRLSLKVFPVVADSGAIGGYKSEEFMVLSDSGEDTVFFNQNTGQAFNKEIFERTDYEVYLREEYGINEIGKLVPQKAIEVGHIFQLGTKYSSKMKNSTFVNQVGEEKPYVMGCYGIGISRIIATIYENSILRDKNGKIRGISIPSNISPYLIQIIPKGDNINKMLEAEKFYNLLNKEGVKSIFDDRPEITMGAKIKDAKILGTPYLAILGDRTVQEEVELENSKTGQKVILRQTKLAEILRNFEKIRYGNPDVILENFLDFK